MPSVCVSKSAKPYKRYDPLILKTAIEAYEIGNRSLVEIAKQFNIKWGYPLDSYDLLIIIMGLLDRVRIKIKRFTDNLPGVNYIET